MYQNEPGVTEWREWEECESKCNGAMWDQGFDDFVDPCSHELWESYLNMSRAAQQNYDWDDVIDTPYLDDDDDWDEEHHGDEDHHWDDDGGCWDVLADAPCGFLINGLSFGIFLLC